MMEAVLRFLPRQTDSQPDRLFSVFNVIGRWNAMPNQKVKKTAGRAGRKGDEWEYGKCIVWRRRKKCRFAATISILLLTAVSELLTVCQCIVAMFNFTMVDKNRVMNNRFFFHGEKRERRSLRFTTLETYGKTMCVIQIYFSLKDEWMVLPDLPW